MHLQLERKYREELPQPDYIAFDEPFDLEHEAKASVHEVERSDGEIRLILCMSDGINLLSCLTVSLTVDKNAHIEHFQLLDMLQTQSRTCGNQHDIEASVSYVLGNDNRVVWGLHLYSQQWLQNPVAFELLAYTDGSIDWLPKRKNKQDDTLQPHHP